MKKILIATDFSANATHAARYGYNLASQAKANVVLCNAFTITTAIPEFGILTWPQVEYEELQKSSNTGLTGLKKELEGYQDGSSFKSEINCCSNIGSMIDVINEITSETEVELTVMGAHGSSKLDTLLLGNHARRMIDQTKTPLLLVPASAALKPVKKVAFATDLEYPDLDAEAIFELIPLLKRLNAELLLVHVYAGGHPNHKLDEHMQSLIIELSNKADYPNIFYRMVSSSDADRGLDWLCDHGRIDILVMAHHRHHLLNKIFIGSHAQKMADHIDIPLLVIPENQKQAKNFRIKSASLPLILH
jgi:nucleotide-binding universal stress UspA family protein